MSRHVLPDDTRELKRVVLKIIAAVVQLYQTGVWYLSSTMRCVN